MRRSDDDIQHAERWHDRRVRRWVAVRSRRVRSRAHFVEYRRDRSIHGWYAGEWWRRFAGKWEWSSHGD